MREAGSALFSFRTVIYVTQFATPPAATNQPGSRTALRRFIKLLLALAGPLA